MWGQFERAGKGAYEEVAGVKKEGIEIELVTVQDIIVKKL